MKKKVITLSLLTIVMCASLIVGATLALFTSKSNVNIAVTSGNVEVVATVDASEAQSKQLNEEYAKGLDHTFAQGVSINGGTVTLKDFVPGDGVKFDIKIHNASSVPVKYRTIVTNNGSEELFNALDVTFNGEQPQWDELLVGSADKTVNVTVEFPDEADGVQNQTTTLTFTVEAVQGNAEVPTVVTNTDEFVAALQDESVEEIELARGVFDLSGVNTMQPNNYGIMISRPVTVYGAGDATVLKFGNNGNAISGQADLMISSSNVVLRDFAVVGGHTDNGNVSTIKVTNLAEGGGDPDKITLQTLTVTAGAGHAINVHGATNVTIDGCTLSDYGKAGVAMARATATVKNTTFTNAAAWGDIGLMYDTKPGFETPSHLILGEGNVFAKNLIYSERPASAEGGKDTVEGASAYGVFVESEAGWTIVAPVAKIGDVEYVTLRDALDAAKEGDTIDLVADVTYAVERANNEDFRGIAIEGNDYTITFKNAKGDIQGGVYHDLMNVNLKNATVVDETFYNAENGENAWEFTYLELYGAFENVIFTDGIMVTGDSSFSGCTFIGHNNDSSEYGNTTMYGVWVECNVNVTFTGCTFKGTRGLKLHDQYGEFASGYAGNTLVDGCTFENLTEKPGIALGTIAAEADITLKNNIFINTQPGDGLEGEVYGVPYQYETDTPVENFHFTAEGNQTILG